MPSENPQSLSLEPHLRLVCIDGQLIGGDEISEIEIEPTPVSFWYRVIHALKLVAEFGLINLVLGLNGVARAHHAAVEPLPGRSLDAAIGTEVEGKA